MKNKIKDLELHLKLIITIVGIISIIWTVFNGYNAILGRFDNMDNRIARAEQTALKSIIWNEKIPLVERVHSCDEYINLKFDSYTKDYCKKILGGIK